MASIDPIQNRLDGIVAAVKRAGGHLPDISSPLMAAMTDKWTLDVRESFIRIVLSGVEETLLPKALIFKFEGRKDARVPWIVASSYLVSGVPTEVLLEITPEY